ncbi:unnamed protein product [Amoebophrya sp. A120]|nr:unnamed protein product [Amoebophrya sp. A120]|eukprot:GSA120T00024904001.1
MQKISERIEEIAARGAISVRQPPSAASTKVMPSCRPLAGTFFIL